MGARGAADRAATAAYGVAREMRRNGSDGTLARVCEVLNATRPTAVNLKWALARCRSALDPLTPADRAAVALALADQIADEDVAINHAIGQHGLSMIRATESRRASPRASRCAC